MGSVWPGHHWSGEPVPVRPSASVRPPFSVVGRDDEVGMMWEYPGAPQALILVPTRELAIQVGEDLAIAAKLRNARIATLYGGVPIEPQAELLRRGLEVAVAPRSHYRPVPAGAS